MSHPKLALDCCIPEPDCSRLMYSNLGQNKGCDIKMPRNNLICISFDLYKIPWNTLKLCFECCYLKLCCSLVILWICTFVNYNWKKVKHLKTMKGGYGILIQNSWYFWQDTPKKCCHAIILKNAIKHHILVILCVCTQKS